MKLEEIEKKYANWWEYEGTVGEVTLVDIQWLISRVRELETKVEKYENGITYYDKVQELVSRILNLEAELDRVEHKRESLERLLKGDMERVEELEEILNGIKSPTDNHK